MASSVIIQPWSTLRTQFRKRLKCENAPTLTVIFGDIFNLVSTSGSKRYIVLYEADLNLRKQDWYLF